MRRLRATIDDRPEFMEVLGLLPPYSTRDVKQAYRSKVRQAHPDAGGDAARFIEVRQAYERALDFCRFRDSRREWIGENVEKYMSRLQVIRAIEACGGTVELQSEQSFLRSYGPDFADVLRQLVVVELSGREIDDGSLSCLADGCDVLNEVRLLVLSGSRITDGGMQSLSHLGGLRFLDLSRTAITPRGLDNFGRLSNLEWIHLGRTRVGFFARRRLKRALPGLDVVTRMGVTAPRGDPDWYLQPRSIRVYYWRAPVRSKDDH